MGGFEISPVVAIAGLAVGGIVVMYVVQEMEKSKAVEAKNAAENEAEQTRVKIAAKKAEQEKIIGKLSLSLAKIAH
jgi:hypothetical protein